MNSFKTTAAALALVAGSVLGTAPLHAEEPPDMDGTWVNRSLKMDNEPAMGAVIKGRTIEMFVPPFIPGGDRMEMTLEVLETDPQRPFEGVPVGEEHLEVGHDRSRPERPPVDPQRCRNSTIR